MDFNFYPLWAFVAVVRQHSLTRAAAELGISQPAVSAHLKALEKRFGDRLLDRGVKGAHLTPLGAEVYARALVLLEELQGLDELAAGESRSIPVSLAASHTPGVYWLPAQLVEFRRRYGLECRYAVSDSSQALAEVLDRRVALGLVGDLPLGQEVERVEVGRDELRLMGCGAQDTLILRELGSSTRVQAEAMLGSRNFARVLTLNSGEAVKEAVLAGLGVAVLSSWSVAREVEAGLLRPIGRWRRERPIYLVRLRGRSLRGAVRLLWEFLATSGAG